MFEDYTTFSLDISLFALTSSLILYLTGNDVTQYAGSIWRHLSELSVGIRILILVTVLVVWIVVSYLCGASILPDYGRQRNGSFSFWSYLNIVSR